MISKLFSLTLVLIVACEIALSQNTDTTKSKKVAGLSVRSASTAAEEGWWGGDNDFIYNANQGSVGIGTSVGTAKLNIFGDQGFDRSVVMDNELSTAYGVEILYGGVQKSYLKHDGSGYLSGNLGIGTTTPQVRLDIAGSTTSSSLKIGTVEAQGYALNNSWFGENIYFNGSNFKNRATGEAGLFYFQGREGQFRFYTSQSAGTSLNVTNPAQLKINANGSVGIGGGISNVSDNFTGSKLFVNGSNGNVGIGTTTPGSKLALLTNAGGTGVSLQSGDSTLWTSYKLGRHIEDGTWGVATANGIYSDFATASDVVLRADTKNLILTTRNSSGAIRFGTGSSDVERMIIDNQGNVGIGTANPGTYRLSVAGDGFFGNNLTIANQKNLIMKNGANYDISVLSMNATNDVVLGAGPANVSIVSGSTTATFSNGNVGIGTVSPSSRLDVNGTIKATEIIVALNSEAGGGAQDDKKDSVDSKRKPTSTDADENTQRKPTGSINGWPDFVFAKDYNLMSLDDLSKIINDRGHLPGIPTAVEVAQKGLNIGEMQAMLLQKVEELTLYVIDLKKKNDELTASVIELRKK